MYAWPKTLKLGEGTPAQLEAQNQTCLPSKLEYLQYMDGKVPNKTASSAALAVVKSGKVSDARDPERTAAFARWAEDCPETKADLTRIAKKLEKVIHIYSTVYSAAHIAFQLTHAAGVY